MIVEDEAPMSAGMVGGVPGGVPGGSVGGVLSGCFGGMGRHAQGEKKAEGDRRYQSTQAHGVLGKLLICGALSLHLCCKRGK